MAVATPGPATQQARTGARTLFCVLGVSTPLLHAVVSIFKGALEGEGGACALVVGNTVSDMREGWAASGAGSPASTIFTSDSPDDTTVELFSRAGARMIVAVEDFVDAAIYLRAARGMSTPHALRFLTQTLSTLAPALTGGQALLLRSRHADAPLESLLACLFDFIGRDAIDVAAVLRRIGAAGEETLRGYAQTHFPFREAEPPPADELAVMRALAQSYQPLLSGRAMAAASWPTELFLDWDRPGDFLHGPVDLTGPARFIVCGPYLHLPLGRWRARFLVRIADNWSGNRMSLDIFSHEVLAGVAADLPAEGLYEFDVGFEVSSAYAPLEARIQIQQGAIEGAFELVAVDFVAEQPGES